MLKIRNGRSECMKLWQILINFAMIQWKTKLKRVLKCWSKRKMTLKLMKQTKIIGLKSKKI